MRLYCFRSGDFPPKYNQHLSAAGTDDSTSGGHESGAREAQAQYTRSRSEPQVRKITNKKEEAVVRTAKKSSSSKVKKLKRAPAPRAALVVRDKEEAAAAVSVDASADDFINKFRQQLQLQRLNPMLNYKEMINRGL